MKTYLVFLCFLASFACSHAATIVWNKGKIIGDTDVVTQGVSFGAYSLGSSTDATVNTVLFTGTTGSGRSGSSGDGNLQWAVTTTGPNFTPGNALGYLAGIEGLPPGYSDLLFQGLSISGTNAGNSQTVQFTFNNLIQGNTYIIQFWTNNSREALTNANPLTFANGDDSTSSIEAVRNENKAVGSTGYWVTAEFVADSTTQNITVTGNQWMNVNAVQIRDITIPEPGVAALGVFGLVSLALRRRRF